MTVEELQQEVAKLREQVAYHCRNESLMLARIHELETLLNEIAAEIDAANSQEG